MTRRTCTAEADALSLSILIPTVSRPTLARTLRSLCGQGLGPADEVLLLGDGEQPTARSLFEQFGLPGRYVAVPGPSRDWGYTPRNHGMPLARGRWLTFMDDDDAYAPGALAVVRAALAVNPPRPHLFRMRYVPSGETLWRRREVAVGNVSTQMFVLPAAGPRGAWGRRYEGDYDFIASTLARWPAGALVWREEVIAHVWPSRDAGRTSP
jgi:glycosyltransferase involved in cell wall biosynthesis